MFTMKKAVCPIHKTPLRCPRCDGASGGKAKVPTKGFGFSKNRKPQTERV